MEIQQNRGNSTREACQTLKSLVADCIEEIAGGKLAQEWRDETQKLAASTVALTNSKTTDLLGKPWEIEVRTALSYFHRYKDRVSGVLELESNLGLVRPIASPQPDCCFCRSKKELAQLDCLLTFAVMMPAFCVLRRRIDCYC